MSGANIAQITSRVSIPTGIQGIFRSLSCFPALPNHPAPEEGTNMLSGLGEAKFKHQHYRFRFNPIALGVPQKKGSWVGAFALKVNIGQWLV